jgi:hypothetical protein
VIKRFGKDTNHVIKEQVAWALVTKGISLLRQRKSEGAIAVFAQLGNGFKEDMSIETRLQDVWVLVTKGITLLRQRKSENAFAVFNQLVKNFMKNT